MRLAALGSEDPRPARKRARFQEILAAAWDVANEQGLAALTLGEVARRVGLRQPSLYAYIDSKMRLYDAMFAQAARALMDRVMAQSFSGDPRRAVRQIAEVLFEFLPANPAGGQLLFLRTIPGFEPSPESYAIAQEFLVLTVDKLTAAGVTDPADVDLFTAIIGGLANAQASNEPGGDRWTRHLDTVLGMFFGHIDDLTTTAAGRRNGTSRVSNPSAGPARPAPARTSKRRQPAAAPSSGGGPS
jgi:AcrR family transcriptional regulator